MDSKIARRQEAASANGHRSSWTEIESSVIQVGFLGPLLFTIFINDIDEVIYKISKFADDSKIASQVNSLNDIRTMQRTLDKLVAWANRQEMDLNVNKSEVMHIGKINLDFQYHMNDGWVKSVDEKWDLEVLMSKDLKFSKQCLLAKNKANLILGIIYLERV